MGRQSCDYDGCDLEGFHKAQLTGSLATERAGAQRVEGAFIIVLVAMQLSD